MSAPEASDNQISEVLDSLHLLSFRERHPMSLSGGQKQRLAVATALLSEKPVLIFDEPTSGLDYARMVEVSGVIRSLARHGRIVLVVTHDPHTALMSERRIVLGGGAITAVVGRSPAEAALYQQLEAEYQTQRRYQTLLRKGELLA